jgi:hypothetical protein
MDNIKTDAAPEHDEHDHAHDAPPRRKRRMRFGDLLLQWARERRPKAPKPRKEMTEEELRALKTERNRRRRRKASAAKSAKGLASKLPVPNTCRRRRLAAKHPERKWERK